MTHADLVELAARWLRRKYHSTVVTSKSIMDSEEPDAIGWTANGISTLIECKRTRKDFLADAKKPWRVHPPLGMGFHRYFLAPAGIIKPSEVPDKWGLLEVVGGRKIVCTLGVCLGFTERNVMGELRKVLSHVRRLEGKVRPIRRPETGPANRKPVQLEVKLVGDAAGQVLDTFPTAV